MQMQDAGFIGETNGRSVFGAIKTSDIWNVFMVFYRRKTSKCAIDARERLIYYRQTNRREPRGYRTHFHGLLTDMHNILLFKWLWIAHLLGAWILKREKRQLLGLCLRCALIPYPFSLVYRPECNVSLRRESVRMLSTVHCTDLYGCIQWQYFIVVSIIDFSVVSKPTN